MKREILHVDHLWEFKVKSDGIQTEARSTCVTWIKQWDSKLSHDIEANCQLVQDASQILKLHSIQTEATRIVRVLLTSNAVSGGGGIFLRDLKLSGASWEGGRGCIIEAPESRDICDLPIVWLKPVEVIRSRAPSAKVEKLQSDLPFFNCPLFVGKSWGEDASALVTSLPLPTAVPEELLKQRRMAIVSHTC